MYSNCFTFIWMTHDDIVSVRGWLVQVVILPCSLFGSFTTWYLSPAFVCVCVFAYDDDLRIFECKPFIKQSDEGNSMAPCNRSAGPIQSRIVRVVLVWWHPSLPRCSSSPNNSINIWSFPQPIVVVVVVISPFETFVDGQHLFCRDGPMSLYPIWRGKHVLTHVLVEGPSLLATNTADGRFQNIKEDQPKHNTANNAAQHATRYLVSLFDKVRPRAQQHPAARPPDQERKKQAKIH